MTQIADVRIHPLCLPLVQPYHWAQGVRHHFAINLVEVVADDGTRGYGECTVAPDQAATAAILERLRHYFIGASPFDVTALIERAFRGEYLAWGANTQRAANQMFAGIDTALWDLQGRMLDLPVHRLFGGARRERVGYFHFLQGGTVAEIATDAAEAVAEGQRVFYLKVGRGDDTDLETVAAVRREIGSARLRLDANEAWSPHQTIRMCRQLERFDIEFLEQPVPGWNIEALAHVRQAVGIPIVADQAAFTLSDVDRICQRRAADMICIGIREIGGIQPLLKAATVAEAAGLSICIHGSFTSGITTCAEHQAALAIPNLDDGNQIMCQLLSRDLVASPVLRPQAGWLDAITGPGLGCALDPDALADGANRYREEAGDSATV
ncbi:MAG: mandelate racemase/muconate lactonizing enzyme family protein [Halofilum sp. (in: g-proteobacteria)]|nr:mandelate racemase/muconate lactonizing enzyme family protein [Halofilum sp. (in: g-proteobacteria)]